MVPEWPTSIFYSELFNGEVPKEPFKLARVCEPFIYQNQGAKSALNGKVLFRFIALYFKTF
jgi:hypothetical protein